MHFVYIIYSPSFDKYYVGETLDVTLRLQEHNTKFYTSSSTTYTKDWQLERFIIVKNRREARIIESYIKSMKSKKFIKSLIVDDLFYTNFKKLVLYKFEIEIQG